MDEELSKCVHWSEFKGVGNLFLQFRQLLLRKKPFKTEEVLYFKSIAFSLWFLLYTFWRRMYEEYKNEDARYALQYVSLSPTPHFSAFCIRNINNRDILVTLAILIETTLRAPGVYNEGPAEQTFKFCVGDKKKRCVKFTEGKSESSRDYWKILAKLARLRLKRCRGHWRRGIKYAPPVVIVFAPCLPSVFANFRWNIPQWTRELLAKSSYHDKVLSSQDGFMKIRWSDKHSDQLICGCGCCELFLDRQEFKHHLSIENILWRWKKFMKQKRTWKNIVEEWFQHQNRYAGDVEGAEFADLRVCPFEFLTQNRN